LLRIQPAWGHSLLDTRPFYVAHRGGSADWPEQSMLAYRSAVACGVDALEVSLARSADGVWFGLHDNAAGTEPASEVKST
jgi:glycerophosphoryl diester phosphodiesterase